MKTDDKHLKFNLARCKVCSIRLQVQMMFLVPVAPYPAEFGRKKRDADSELQEIIHMNLHGKKRSPNSLAQGSINQ